MQMPMQPIIALPAAPTHHTDEMWTRLLAAAPPHILETLKRPTPPVTVGHRANANSVVVCTHPQPVAAMALLPAAPAALPRPQILAECQPSKQVPSAVQQVSNANGDGKPAWPTSEPPTDGSSVLRQQDRLLPMANVAKIMARQLGHLGYAKVSNDAKVLMQEAATEFICFIMSETNDIAVEAKRKSVTGPDVINACQRMDLAEFYEPLTNALPHLQPVKRKRGKDGGDDAQAPHRRRCRVSDEEAEALRLRRCLAQLSDGVLLPSVEA